MADRLGQIELDPASTAEGGALSAAFEAGEDRRPKLEEPPPVRLVSVEDCQLWVPAGLERQLDEFYAGLLNFERQDLERDEGGHELIYRAENFRLRIEVLERPLPREDFRPLGVVVPSLNDLARRLAEAKIEYERQRGLVPGQDNLLLYDPAGNSVMIGEYRLAI
ncbi:MAG: hypothetical protein ABSB42_21510 [Tepidisphaeraceae bacterium]|jgi:hypothetical protein